MKKATITKQQAEIAKKLKKVASKFPSTERMYWGAKNQISLVTINRYLKGEIGSLIIAEKLYNDIVEYTGQNQAA